MTRDPVCGMTVDSGTSTHRSRHDGHEYCFCSLACKDAFDAEPGAYARRKGLFTRLLDWIIKGNQRTYHGHPPNCCDR